MKYKKALVVGLGKSGIATCNYLLKKGYQITAVDKQVDKEEIQQWYQSQQHLPLKIAKDDLFQEVLLYDEVIVSPGVPRDHLHYQEALKNNIPVFSEAQLILKGIKQPCIGITGSNGKTTLTLFLEHVLNQSYLPAKAIGNVGIPFTEYALENEKGKDILVCELSSYHLETLSAQVLDVGILLDITPDHLDRYPHFDAYAQAKLQIVKCIKPGGVLLLSEKMYTSYQTWVDQCLGQVVIIPKEFSKGDKDSYLQLTKNREYCDFLGLVQEKALSVEVLYLAKQVLKIFSSEDKYLGQAIATFKKPAHRLEFIRTIDGIRFVNDSKATNIESVIYAVNRIEGDILLIAGGKDKGLSFKEWMNHFGSKVVKVFAIGESAMKIKASLEAGYLVELCPNLEIATQKAFTCATAKSTVLLAPGCASFDSYRDYMHRGECFREIVMALKEKE